MSVSEKFARIWLLSLPLIVALLGIGISVRPLLVNPGTEGEDWSLLAGGVIVTMAVLALVTSVPSFLLLRESSGTRSAGRTRLAVLLVAAPVLAVAVPLLGGFRLIFIPSAFASAPMLVILASQSIKRKWVRT